MSTTEENPSETQEGGAVRGPGRPRGIRTPNRRKQLLIAVNRIAETVNQRFDDPTLKRILDINDDEFAALREQIFNGVSAAPARRRRAGNTRQRYAISQFRIVATGPPELLLVAARGCEKRRVLPRA